MDVDSAAPAAAAGTSALPPRPRSSRLALQQFNAGDFMSDEELLEKFDLEHGPGSSSEGEAGGSAASESAAAAAAASAAAPSIRVRRRRRIVMSPDADDDEESDAAVSGDEAVLLGQLLSQV